MSWFSERWTRWKARASRGEKIAFVVGVFVVGIVLSAAGSGFQKADLDEMKRMIRVEFEKKPGVTVKEVFMMRESSTKATGFVKLNVAGLVDVVKNCSATMGDSSEYVWRCE